jgi:hypothetical protein
VLPVRCRWGVRLRTDSDGVSGTDRIEFNWPVPGGAPRVDEGDFFLDLNDLWVPGTRPGLGPRGTNTFLL